jgi:hypothetical protein
MSATSRKSYPCYACQRAGHEVQVFLDGKDEQGRTKYLNEDGTRHIHYQYRQRHEDESSYEIVSLQEQQPNQEQASPLYHVSDESVDRGISASSMMTNLIGLVEQNQWVLVSLEGKIDRLLNLVFATQSEQQQQ